MNRQHDETQQVDLGFAQVELPPGTHICQIYDDESARTDAFVAFLRKGMELKELSAGFSDEISREGLLRELEDEAFEEAIRLQRTSDAYFTNNTFDPDGMIERLTSFHEASQEQPYTGGRVVGEMSPAIKRMEGSERLLEYEAKVNLLLRDRPMAIMCQYNARAFDGATLMDVLKAHALMVVRGSVVHNPFYLPPEEILASS